jgi:uncharacterized membrane protein YgdD (TMEM256/DUF423 family)
MTHQAESTKGMKCVPAACFTLASLAAVAGISLGMFMGINDDHTLTPVHAHINLIGWVSMFLFGAYYNMFPHTVGLLAKIQVTLVAIGYVVAFGALAVMLMQGEKNLLPFTITGSVMVLAGFLLFCVVVCREALKSI